jgi:gamma-glutamyltranspeptidase/glutathione hydrolase
MLKPPALLSAALLIGACEATAPPPPPPAPAAAVPAVTADPVAEAPTATASAAPAPPAYPQPPPPDPPVVLHGGGKHAVRGEGGVVTSVEANATHIGAEVLRHGGNAVDAAVAVAFALAVTHPSAGNIGGGGFMMVRLPNGEAHAIDFRETAPAADTPEKNQAMLDLGGLGYTSAGVPGTVAGMTLALERFGSRPLAELIAPAIALAKKGHKLGPRAALVLSWTWRKIHDKAARAVWGHGGGPHAQGDLVKQPDLARTLEAIAKQGRKGFYEGPVAAAIDKAMRAHGGYVTAADLAAYEAKEREPLRFSYRGFTVDTMPPPSMGGVAFAEIMLALERARAYEAPADSGLAMHLFVEAARRAYAERRLVGADPDFLPDPDKAKALIARLLGGEHLATRRPPIDAARATPSSELVAAAEGGEHESPETTHFSVVDAQGMAVACTYTLSAPFGSKVMIPGTGVILGNAMGGFSSGGINALAPGKRMASSMSPTIVSRGGKLALVLGSPGGDTIPNTVAQVFRNVVDWGMTIDVAVRHPRIHHQFLPDRVRIETTNAPPAEALADLERRGHTIKKEPSTIGDANDILVDADGVAWGAADIREGGKAEGVEKR